MPTQNPARTVTPVAVRRALVAEDGSAFRDLTHTPAPRSGEPDRIGFILTPASGGAVSVASARRSLDPKRPRDMRAYADVLRAAGFSVVATERDGRVTAVKVVR